MNALTLWSSSSEQLNTKQSLPNDFDKSFTVSVFPVPAGPTSNSIYSP
jgi:hypothetical protein